MTFQSWKDESVPVDGVFDSGPSFNGAMTFQSWKGGADADLIYKSTGLQWGHDFSVMESLSKLSRTE